MSRIFGKTVAQNGYVVRDIEAAMKHWIEVLGVGPWFYMASIPVEDFRYKGEYFKKIKTASQDWDGSDPIRKIATLAT